VYTYILFILLYGANALGGTSVIEFCSSRLEMEYTNIISDVIINCRRLELVARKYTLQLYRQLNISYVYISCSSITRC
jgi:hypothetical protein